MYIYKVSNIVYFILGQGEEAFDAIEILPWVDLGKNKWYSTEAKTMTKNCDKNPTCEPLHPECKWAKYILTMNPITMLHHPRSSMWIYLVWFRCTLQFYLPAHVLRFKPMRIYIYIYIHNMYNCAVIHASPYRHLLWRCRWAPVSVVYGCIWEDPPTAWHPGSCWACCWRDGVPAGLGLTSARPLQHRETGGEKA